MAQDIELASDQELIALTREGNSDAFALLWKRHYAVALSLARSLWPSEAEDLVSEAFANVLRAIKNGSGPTEAFRAYLCMVIRNLDTRNHAAADQVRIGLEEYGRADSPVEGALISDDDNERIRRIFYAMKPQSRKLLWMSAVEELKPREIAVQLGIKPNHVTTLTHRARGEFVSLWAQSYVDADKEGHRDFLDHVGEYVAGKASPHVAKMVEEHLEGCEECRASVAEVSEVFSAFRSRIAPAVAGVPAFVLMASTDQAYGATITTPPAPPARLGGGKPPAWKSLPSKLMLTGVIVVVVGVVAALLMQTSTANDTETVAPVPVSPPTTPVAVVPPQPIAPPEPSVAPTPAPTAAPTAGVPVAEPANKPARAADAARPASTPAPPRAAKPAKPAPVPAIAITRIDAGPHNVCYPTVTGTATAGSAIKVASLVVRTGADGTWTAGPLTTFRAGSRAVSASAVDGKQKAASGTASMASPPGLTISRGGDQLAIGIHALAGIPVDVFIDGRRVDTLTAGANGRAQGTYAMVAGEQTVAARYHPAGCEGAVSTLSIE